MISRKLGIEKIKSVSSDAELHYLFACKECPFEQECAEMMHNNHNLNCIAVLKKIRKEYDDAVRWINIKEKGQPSKEFKCPKCNALVVLPIYAMDCYYHYCPYCGERVINSNE